MTEHTPTDTALREIVSADGVHVVHVWAPWWDNSLNEHGPVWSGFQTLGADSVTHLSVDGLKMINGAHICDACFTGDYVVPVSEAERKQINAARRP